MRRRTPQVSTRPASGQADLPAAHPVRRRPRWWVMAIAVVASIGISVIATVAPAEHDAYMRTHSVVPSLIGTTVAGAARMMVPLHLGIVVLGSLQDANAPIGVILVQNPPPGRVVPIGSVIQLRVSQGSGLVPRLRGAPVHEAARRLEGIGLRLGRVSGMDDDSPPGTVLEQFTPPGHRLDANSPVDVLVSQGRGEAASVPPSSEVVPAAVGPKPGGVPPLVAPSLGSVPSTLVLTPTRAQPSTSHPPQEGTTRAGSASGVCSGDAERERAQVCYQPANDRGPEPDLYGPEHRGLPTGP